MSNHLHLVLRNRPDIAEQWSAEEIALRWCRVFPPRDDATGEPVEPDEHDLAMLTANSDRLAEVRETSNIQAGGGPIELARRCRGPPLAALVPGQGGGSNRLCVGHWLDTEPSTDISITLSLEERRSARALNSLPGAVSTGRTVPLVTSSDHARTTVVSIGSVSDRPEAPRAACPGRLLRPTS